MFEIERRALMKGAALSALTFTVGGAKFLLSPRQARAQNIAFKTLTPEQVETLEAIGETLVPGSKEAGVSHFVDQQLSVPPGEALLEARILNVRPPYANFYRAALGAVDKASKAHNSDRGIAQLKDGWQGPAGPFVYLVLRSDAVDVVYGTMEGYAALGIPYMPHIAPQKRW